MNGLTKISKSAFDQLANFSKASSRVSVSLLISNRNASTNANNSNRVALITGSTSGRFFLLKLVNK